jgi:hypothetical protein
VYDRRDARLRGWLPKPTNLHRPRVGRMRSEVRHRPHLCE